MCILSPSLVPVRSTNNPTLDRICKIYGIHGYLYFWKEKIYLEVYQLDFSTIMYDPQYRKSPEFKIPINEQQAYCEALLESGLLINVVPRGGKYNLIIERTDQKKESLPILEAI